MFGFFRRKPQPQPQPPCPWKALADRAKKHGFIPKEDEEAYYSASPDLAFDVSKDASFKQVMELPVVVIAAECYRTMHSDPEEFQRLLQAIWRDRPFYFFKILAAIKEGRPGKIETLVYDYSWILD